MLLQQRQDSELTHLLCDSSPARNASRWCLAITLRRPAFTDPSCPVRSRSRTVPWRCLVVQRLRQGCGRAARRSRCAKISCMMASSSSSMSLASSRAIALVLNSTGSAASGTGGSLPASLGQWCLTPGTVQACSERVADVNRRSKIPVGACLEVGPPDVSVTLWAYRREW